jgi:hypothetical protein
MKAWGGRLLGTCVIFLTTLYDVIFRAISAFGLALGEYLLWEHPVPWALLSTAEYVALDYGMVKYLPIL